jgi:hypothetical protein
VPAPLLCRCRCNHRPLATAARPLATTARPRAGKWKYVAGGISCDSSTATFDCSKEQLYDMSVDWAEEHDLAAKHPDVLTAIAANFTVWYESVHDSIANESKCQGSGPSPAPDVPFPPHPVPSSQCQFTGKQALAGSDIAKGSVASREVCCGACRAIPGCAAADFVVASAMRPTWEGVASGGTCHLKAEYVPKPEIKGEIQTACVPTK